MNDTPTRPDSAGLIPVLTFALMLTLTSVTGCSDEPTIPASSRPQDSTIAIHDAAAPVEAQAGDAADQNTAEDQADGVVALATAPERPILPPPPEGPPADIVVVQMQTSLGPVTIELNHAKAPITVKNFLGYLDSGFYDGLIFHRVIANFMVQTGGYDADLQLRQAGPDIKSEANNGLANAKGTLAMARQDDPDSANSQFFINARDNHHLDQLGYTVFGRVTSGLNVIEDIELVATQVVGPLTDLPVTPITIDWLRRAPVAE